MDADPKALSALYESSTFYSPYVDPVPTPSEMAALIVSSLSKGTFSRFVRAASS